MCDRRELRSTEHVKSLPWPPKPIYTGVAMAYLPMCTLRQAFRPRCSISSSTAACFYGRHSRRFVNREETSLQYTSAWLLGKEVMRGFQIQVGDDTAPFMHKAKGSMAAQCTFSQLHRHACTACSHNQSQLWLASSRHWSRGRLSSAVYISIS